MPDLDLLSTLFVYVIPIIFAITFHEVAHGWVASQFGDQTAKSLGRLTLNPIKHIDPVGTIVVPAVMFYASGFIFGWAKPVPKSWSSPKRYGVGGPCRACSKFLDAIILGHSGKGHFIAWE